jgi:hypothetical protein
MASLRREPCRRGAVAGAKRQIVQLGEVPHAAFFIERGRDQALAAQHRRAAEAPLEKVEMGHAVQQRQDRGLRPHRRGEGLHGLDQVVGLAAQQDEVVGRAELVGGDRRRGEVGIAARAADREARLGQLCRPARADQEGHVAAGLQQAAAEIAADGAGADDQDAHVRQAPGSNSTVAASTGCA